MGLFMAENQYFSGKSAENQFPYILAAAAVCLICCLFLRQAFGPWGTCVCEGEGAVAAGAPRNPVMLEHYRNMAGWFQESWDGCHRDPSTTSFL